MNTKTYRTKPRTVNATKWTCRANDNPDVADSLFSTVPTGDKSLCRVCFFQLRNHGSMQTPKGFVTICPGDYIVTDSNGEKRTYREKEFNENFETMETQE